MKVTYICDAEGRTSKAYLSEVPLEDGSYVGVNKHTELPVHLTWNDDYEAWVEVCRREFIFADYLCETYEEVLPRPDCSCVGHDVKVA